MNKIVKKISDEFFELLPAMIYFFVAFNALGYTKALLLRQYGISVNTFAAATVGALVVAKVLFVVGLLPFMEPFRKTPITYNALWKTFLSSLVAIGVQWLEEVIPLLFHHESLEPAMHALTTVHFWVLQFWLFVLLFGYWLVSDLIEAIGPATARKIFLRSKDN